jgi:C_GCAxxG_C_C family probable redox protein
MTYRDQALNRFSGASNCAQSILETYLPLVGIRETTATAMGAGLGGGLGGMQETCGALNGGCIVLSYGCATDGDRHCDPGQQVAALVDRFREEFGSARCRDLLGYDRNDPAAVAAAPPDAKDICPRCVSFVADALDNVLHETPDEGTNEEGG